MSFLLALAFLLGAFAAFDVVVRAGYADNFADWEASGSPHGFFWVPQESRGFLGFPSLSAGAARTICALEWLLVSPSWVAGNRSLRIVVWLYRIFVLCWLLWFGGLFVS